MTRIRYSFSSANTIVLFSALARDIAARRGAPRLWMLDSEEVDAPPFGSDGLSSFLARAAQEAECSWGEILTDGYTAAVWNPNHPVLLVLRGSTISPSADLTWLSQQDFTVAAMAAELAEAEGRRGSLGFEIGHLGYDFAAFFKGPGHDLLVSRRWLDYGPWLLRRGPNDTSMVQLHDLDATPEEIRAQLDVPSTSDEEIQRIPETLAEAQQRRYPPDIRLGRSPVGGYLGPASVRPVLGVPQDYQVTTRFNGTFDPRTGVMQLPVLGREVTQQEMLDACFIRAHKATSVGGGQRLKNFAYVFLDEAEAAPYLHDLWLRELEVWVLVQGRHQRIDLDYTPQLVKPDWVYRVMEREGLSFESCQLAKS